MQGRDRLFDLHPTFSLGQAQQAHRMHDTEDSLSFVHLAKCSDLRDREQ